MRKARYVAHTSELMTDVVVGAVTDAVVRADCVTADSSSTTSMTASPPGAFVHVDTPRRRSATSHSRQLGAGVVRPEAGSTLAEIPADNVDALAGRQIARRPVLSALVHICQCKVKAAHSSS